MIGGAIVAITGIGGLFYLTFSKNMVGKPLSAVSFVCDQDKTIEASFYKEKVMLSLIDGRKITLPQLVSTSGTRYGNEDGSLVFSNKGDTAFITEGIQKNETFKNCEVAVAGQEARNTYASSTMGISIKYPQSYTVDESYAYDQFGPKKLIHGVKFIIPLAMATGTNLSIQDTGISVEQLPRAKNCTGDIYLKANVKANTIIENDVRYSAATSSGAAAGNMYEEMVYALSGSSPCTAVRYYIHSSNVGDYGTGTIREFDRAALLETFDKIRRSLVLDSIPPTSSPATP